MRVLLDVQAVREGPWKYRFGRAVTEAGPSKEAPVPELFHLEWDPAEQFNVYERHRDIGDRLAAMLKRKAQELGAQ